MSKVTYDIIQAHSSAQFKVRHMMIAKVKGEFSKLTGVVELDTDDIANSKIEASIDVASINTREEQRDQSFKTPTFSMQRPIL